MTTPRRTPQDALKAAGASTEAATRLLERVAARLGGRAAVSAVFGEPVVREDVTVIPVASARFGFGGGATQEDGDGRSNEGGGGGGGATARPLGFIEISKGTAVYRPIRPPGPTRSSPWLCSWRRSPLPGPPARSPSSGAGGSRNPLPMNP